MYNNHWSIIMKSKQETAVDYIIFLFLVTKENSSHIEN